MQTEDVDNFLISLPVFYQTPRYPRVGHIKHRYAC